MNPEHQPELDEGAGIPTDSEPVLRVIKGDPTPEELAALIVVLSRTTPSGQAARPTNRDGWGAYWRGVRAPLSAGPGAWSAAAR